MDEVRRGEIVEALFAAEALRRNFQIYRPFGQLGPIDCIVQDGPRLSRVQVRATSRRWHGEHSYTCCIRRRRDGRHQTYTPDEIDFLAAYVIPEATWYIIPATVIATLRSGITLRPGGKYEPHRNAWHAMAAETSGCHPE